MNCGLCDNCPFVGYKGEVVYEVHVTVDDFTTARLWAEANKIKIIQMDLGAGVPKQLMTSVVTKDFKSTVANLRESCALSGLQILRVKVETTPNNTQHPILYREAHFASTGGSFNHAALSLHKSRNLLSKKDFNVQMYTYRSKLSECKFNAHVEKVKNTIPNLYKTIIESCIIDTNEGLDKHWLGNIH